MKEEEMEKIKEQFGNPLYMNQINSDEVDAESLNLRDIFQIRYIFHLSKLNKSLQLSIL